ncbi:extracellular solute-binding protein [Clostridium grantii]|uniref:Putative aldouronate transport system substrate-binding protein n=1 Tax=Clostridium grantii DSM 8605 TaxID=1121316 RepID=A0A1M5WKE0_9CLOT|nr:extracellular solute-binding protein [Clostridium grantii]SHH87975.1 putative aldouronate transport system substrate-binding protein [Clostridium grantii DSM 8605]
MAVKKVANIKKPFEELETMKQIKEATNVNIEWEETPQETWPEKKNLIIASGDWPDVFYGNYILEDEEVVKLAADGIFIPLEDLIEKYAPNVQKVFEEYPDFKDYITAPDGHIYSLPTINAYQSPAPSAQFINKKWLDELGLEIPTTTDEFYEVLKAFKANAKDGQTPFSFMYGNNTYGIGGMFGSFGLADDNSKITVVDDKVVFTAMQPEYKEAVKYFNKLFNEGLIDLESFSQTREVYNAKVSKGDVGVVNGWSLSSWFGENYQDSGYVFMPPLKGPNGDQSYFYRSSATLSGKGSFLITSKCENPEVAMRLADYMCDPDVSFQASQGMIGGTYQKNADGKLEALPIPEGMNQAEFRHQDAAGANSFHMITAKYLENVIPSTSIAEKQSYEKVYEKFATNSPLPPFSMSPEDSTRISEIRADITSFVDENTSKWLLKGGIDEEWDSYVEKLKQMNVEELIGIYQARYDDFK